MATPDGKRKAEDAVADGDAGQDAKKPRLDNNAGAAAAPAKPGLDLSVIEKAKKALQLQKELKERMKKLQMPVPRAAAPGPAAPGAAVPGPKAKLPPPLVVDAQGREVDASGQPVRRPISLAEAAAAKAGRPPPTAAAPRKPLSLAVPAEEPGAGDARFFDPDISSRGMAKRQERRPRATLRFVEEGRFQKAAEVARLQAKFGDGAVRALERRREAEEAALAAGAGDANLVPLGTRAAAPAAEPVAPIPDVEWWDARVLKDKTSYGGAAEGEAAIREDRITRYVEHPVQLAPPAEAPPPPPQPLKLTKQEVKKLRTQRRVAREAERQLLVQQGLLEPAQPKVKISNLMRVLGEEATADPTAVEAEVRRQMAEREAAHQDRNLANRLTPAERRAKKLRKVMGAPAAEGACHVAVYRVGDLSSPALRFKVEANAREARMSGVAIAGAEFCLVVVEGGPKPQRRYERLMLERINWAAAGAAEEEEDEDEGSEPKAPNYCRMVWQGVTPAPVFKKFRLEAVTGEVAARALLADHGVEHFWDVAKATNPE